MEIPDVNEFIASRRKLIEEIEQGLDQDDEEVRNAEKELIKLMKQEMEEFVEQLEKPEK
jgi:hypothetical protein